MNRLKRRFSIVKRTVKKMNISLDVKSLCQTVLPIQLRKKLCGLKFVDFLNKQYAIRKICEQYGDTDDAEIISLLKHLNRTKGNPVLGGVVQNDLVFEYRDLKVEVQTDDANGLKYVCDEDGKKLYFKRGMKNSDVISSYKLLLIEQDKRSGHCYFRNMDLYSRGGCL